MEEKSEAPKKKNFTDKMRENPWIISTIVMGIFVLILLITGFAGMNGSVVSENEAGGIIVNLAKTQMGDIEIINIEKESGLYKISYSSSEGNGVVYLTLDGRNLVGGLIPLEDEEPPETSQSIPKENIPKAELFIWSYCPYGVQAQTPFAEVASLLKNYADFEVVLYYDGHGEHETQQNKIQACIQELDKEKYWDYASGFVENIYPVCSLERTEECDRTESVKLMDSLGIDSDAVMSCVETQGDDLISADSARAKEVGVTGSPTLVVNGVKASPSSRTAEAFKDVVCSSFSNVPETCGTALSSDAGTASGNC